MADGSIRIETKLDTTGVESSLEDIEKMAEETKENLGKTSESLNLKIDKKDAEQAAESLKANLASIPKKMNKKPLKILNDRDLNKQKNKLAEITAEIERIQAETDKMLPFAVTDEQTENLLKMEEIETEKLIDQQKELQSAVREYESIKAEENANKELKSTNKEIKSNLVGDEFVSKIKNAEQYDRELEKVRNRMHQIETETAKIAKSKGLNSDELLQANDEYQKLNSKLKALIANEKKFKSTSKDAFASATKSAEVMGKAAKKAIKTMGKYTLAIFSARSAFFAIKGAIRDVLADNEELSNTVQGIKGAVAYALTPAVQGLLYYLQYALAYINLFFKRMTGVDHVAEYNAHALSKQAEATRETAEATKEATKQLASFDEKNMLQSTNAKSSTGTSQVDMPTLDLPNVEGGQVDAIFMKIKANLEELELIAGACLIAVGLVLLNFGMFPAGIACIIAGITLAKKALGNWDELSAETKIMLNKIMGIASAAFLAIGIILCCCGVIPLGIGFIIAGVAFGIKAVALNWDELKDKIEITLQIIARIVGSALLVLGAVLMLSGVGIPLGLVLIIAGLAALGYSSDLEENWDKLPDETKQTFEKIKNIVLNIASGAIVALGVVLSLLGNPVLGIALISLGLKGFQKTGVLEGDSLLELVKDAWNKIKNFYNTNIKRIFTRQWWKQQLDGLPQGVKDVINGAIDFVERGLNWIVDKVNRIGFTIPNVKFAGEDAGKRIGFNLPYVRIPRLALGGIVNNPGKGTPIIAGEAGAEAILPLQQNTEWMDMLADKVAERMSVPIINKFIVDGKEVFASFNKTQARFEFATNGGVL